MNKAFNERALFKRIEEPVNKSSFYGIDKSELVKIEILNWGTYRDGAPFKGNIEEGYEYKAGDIAYIKKDSMGIDVGNGKWLIDRGHILLLD